MTANTSKCTKCNGTGHIEAHSNVMGGICFKCWGKGEITTTKAIKREKKTITPKRFYVKKNRKYQVIDRETNEIKGEFAYSGDAIKLVKALAS